MPTDRPRPYSPAPSSDGLGVDDILDAATLEELLLLEAASGPMLLGELTKSFGADAPKRILELGASVRAGDWTGVKTVAHRLRGSAGAIGAKRVSLTARELEVLADQQDGVAAERLLRRLEEELRRALDALERVVTQGQPASAGF